MSTRIKLSCAACKGEVVYEFEKAQDQSAAHERLHGPDCAYKASRFSISYIAESGIPVQSEVIS